MERGLLLSSTMRRWMVIASCLVAACGSTAPAADTSIPARPSGARPASRSAPETYALDALFLGDVARDGHASPTAWERYGYDLDGLGTNASSDDVCTLRAGAPRATQTDGAGGVDNAFGALVVPIGETAAGDALASAWETAAIRAGAWTLELRFDDGLPSLATDVVGIRGTVFVGAPLATPPALDETTDWPVLPSPVTWTNAYATGGTFVSEPSELVLPLDYGGVALPLAIHRAVVTFARDPGDPTRLVDGIIAGVLDTSELVATVRRFAGAISPRLCGTPSDLVATEIERASDILRDGTNAPGVPCDAISIGLGFTARRVANPTSVAPAPPTPPNPCP